jgi:hypothetical protein
MQRQGDENRDQQETENTKKKKQTKKQEFWVYNTHENSKTNEISRCQLEPPPLEYLDQGPGDCWDLPKEETLLAGLYRALKSDDLPSTWLGCAKYSACSSQPTSHSSVSMAATLSVCVISW